MASSSPASGMVASSGLRGVGESQPMTVRSGWTSGSGASRPVCRCRQGVRHPSRGQGHDLTPQVPAKHHRGLEEATHAERRGRPEGDGVNLEQPIEKPGADSELIPHDDHGAFDVGTKSGKPGPQ